MSYYSSVGLNSPISVKKAQYSEDPGLTFDLPMETSGISQLSRDITVNGVTESPDILYKGEDMRKNICLYSEEFDQTGSWAYNVNILLDTNTAATKAPDGTYTATGVIAS